jgi:ArsR family transcriptional regulator
MGTHAPVLKGGSKLKSALSARDADEIALLCKALGHPARVRILKHLIDYGTCFFGDLSTVVPLAPSTVSQHVTILKEAGLINGSVDEQRTCYCVKPERVALLKRLIAAV